jgi:hypothetical protein
MVRSATGSPRSRRESARPFIWRQYSPTSRSPWENWWNSASRCRARASRFPRNCSSRARHATEPGEDHNVHQGPGRGRRGGDVVEGVAPQGEEDLPSPARIVGGRWVQNDGHKGPNVVKSGGLRVEGDNVVGVSPMARGVSGGGRGVAGVVGGCPRRRR